MTIYRDLLKCSNCGQHAARLATISIDVHWATLEGEAVDGDVLQDLLEDVPLCRDCSPEFLLPVAGRLWGDLNK